MPYITLAKIGVTLAALSYFLYNVYDYGVTTERTKWEVIASSNAANIAKLQIEKLQEVAKAQEASAKLAIQLEKKVNDKQIEMSKLNKQLLSANRVLRSDLCTGSHELTTSKDSNTFDVTANSSNSPTLSRGFTEQLISAAGRADQVGIYAEEAHEFIVELCKDKEHFICE